MNHNPTGPQFSALQRAYCCQGEAWRTDIPRSILNECVQAGWLREDRNGHVWLTDAGFQVHEARR